ncbi:hypothetical protein NDU88_004347 [Pleurodeles waltl]|uniref:Uncharacterized protein n=1 Tax=Pleurodeles waltl TaxID=8319 RepID=A0AAV7SIL7_PLEWA|nr:hypothetical protein NDU88_004347 [Pleurodeles waltl]
MAEACKVLATQTLMKGLLAYVANSCKLRHPDWSTKGYQELGTLLTTMERDGVFKVKKDSDKTDKGMMLQQVQQEEEPEGMYYQGARHRHDEGQGYQRRDKGSVQCYVCQRYGTGAEIVKGIEVEEIEMTEMTVMREKIETTVKVLHPTERELAHRYLTIQQDVEESHKEMFDLMVIDP